MRDRPRRTEGWTTDHGPLTTDYGLWREFWIFDWGLWNLGERLRARARARLRVGSIKVFTEGNGGKGKPETGNRKPEMGDERPTTEDGRVDYRPRTSGDAPTERGGYSGGRKDSRGREGSRRIGGGE